MYGFVISQLICCWAEFEGDIEKPAWSRRREKRLGARPVSDMKGRSGVSAGGRQTRGVMGAENMFDDAAAHRVIGR
jgi:hypothetical protein